MEPPNPPMRNLIVAYDFQVEVGAALGAGLAVERRVVVARHVIHRHVQHGQQVFQVGVGHVAAAEDELHILKMPVGCERVNSLQNLVTDSKNFHSSFILP